MPKINELDMKTQRKSLILDELKASLTPYSFDTQKSIAKGNFTTHHYVAAVAKECSKELDACIEKRKSDAFESKGNPFVSYIAEMYYSAQDNPVNLIITDQQHFTEVQRLKGATKVADKAKELNGDTDTDFNDLARRYEAVNRAILRVQRMSKV